MSKCPIEFNSEKDEYKMNLNRTCPPQILDKINQDKTWPSRVEFDFYEANNKDEENNIFSVALDRNGSDFPVAISRSQGNVKCGDIELSIKQAKNFISAFQELERMGLLKE